MLTPLSHWPRILGIVLTAISIGLWCQPASAAPDEAGWFDASQAPAAPAPAPPATAQRPSLAPSPLLEQDAPASVPAETTETDADPRALSDFRPALDPYGFWVNHPTYGTVWVPNRALVGSDFAPYVSRGHWALDEWGRWVWVSDYPFGRVVFHYGRWVWMSDAGWGWVPGYRYAPAWVHWRVPAGSHAYVGWAPMGPDYLWFGGSAVSFWYGSPTPWVFCPSTHVFHRRLHNYVVRDRVLVTQIAGNTRRYAPAAPRAGATTRRLASVTSPPLALARVPAHAIPRERVRAIGTRAPGTRSPASGSFERGGFAPRPGAERPGARLPSRSRARIGVPQPDRRALVPGDSRPAPVERRVQKPETTRSEPVRRAESMQRPERVRPAEPRPAEAGRPPEAVRRADPEPRLPSRRQITPPSAPREEFERRDLPRRRR